MNNKIGIRYEDKYKLERRVAIIPKHVKKLIAENSLDINVVKSEKRIFTDKEFENAGAKLTDNLAHCPVIFGVKEMPIDFFEANKTYIFFSHVIKGQEYNMPMLKKMMDLKCNLIDYEKVVDEFGKRLIFFGKFAGLAGMINSLWSYGLRLKYYGIDTPFLKIQQSHKYNSLDEAIGVISEVGHEIAKNGLPKELLPVTIGFTGYGNVSKGAQIIANLLPSQSISPEELLELKNKKNLPNNIIYKVEFKEENISEPKDSNSEFDLQDYYKNPHNYKNQFEKYVPHLSILMNCMYWSVEYPRIITKDYFEKLFNKGQTKLTVVGDITCDPNGSIEFTHKGTIIEDPIFVYNPITRKPTMGYEGKGVLVMPVDILPSELPRESSISFSDALLKYIPAIAKADYNKSIENIELPNPIKRALILHKGELTKDYKYISEFL